MSPCVFPLVERTLAPCNHVAQSLVMVAQRTGLILRVTLHKHVTHIWQCIVQVSDGKIITDFGKLFFTKIQAVFVLAKIAHSQ